ncbi:putative DNA binding protein [Staphylococcus virus pSp_SNUABM-S]|nr:putative DNA binding protein [Staphylococcus virus pSp_SNUABM-S]
MIIFLSLFIFLTSFFLIIRNFHIIVKKFTKKTYFVLTVRKFRIILVLPKGGDNMKTLKELRTDYGLTQEELGDLFSVSSRTIQNMEKDSTNIKDSLLSKYMRAFNVKYDDIFLGNEYENFVFMNNKKQSIILAFKEKEKVTT